MQSHYSAIEESIMDERSNFIFPRGRYYGEFKPENVVFNANLQEFTQRVNYICNLETSGKISPQEAYDAIKALWKQLRQSKRELNIGDPSSS